MGTSTSKGDRSGGLLKVTGFPLGSKHNDTTRLTPTSPTKPNPLGASVAQPAPTLPNQAHLETQQKQLEKQLHSLIHNEISTNNERKADTLPRGSTFDTEGDLLANRLAPLYEKRRSEPPSGEQATEQQSSAAKTKKYVTARPPEIYTVPSPLDIDFHPLPKVNEAECPQTPFIRIKAGEKSRLNGTPLSATTGRERSDVYDYGTIDLTTPAAFRAPGNAGKNMGGQLRKEGNADVAKCSVFYPRTRESMGMVDASIGDCCLLAHSPVQDELQRDRSLVDPLEDSGYYYDVRPTVSDGYGEKKQQQQQQQLLQPINTLSSREEQPHHKNQQNSSSTFAPTNKRQQRTPGSAVLGALLHSEENCSKLVRMSDLPPSKWKYVRDYESMARKSRKNRAEASTCIVADALRSSSSSNANNNKKKEEEDDSGTETSVKDNEGNRLHTPTVSFLWNDRRSNCDNNSSSDSSDQFYSDSDEEESTGGDAHDSKPPPAPPPLPDITHEDGGSSADWGGGNAPSVFKPGMKASSPPYPTKPFGTLSVMNSKRRYSEGDSQAYQQQFGSGRKIVATNLSDRSRNWPPLQARLLLQQQQQQQVHQVGRGNWNSQQQRLAAHRQMINQSSNRMAGQPPLAPQAAMMNATFSPIAPSLQQQQQQQQYLHQLQRQQQVTPHIPSNYNATALPPQGRVAGAPLIYMPPHAASLQAAQLRQRVSPDYGGMARVASPKVSPQRNISTGQPKTLSPSPRPSTTGVHGQKVPLPQPNLEGPIPRHQPPRADAEKLFGWTLKEVPWITSPDVQALRLIDKAAAIEQRKTRKKKDGRI